MSYAYIENPTMKQLIDVTKHYVVVELKNGKYHEGVLQTTLGKFNEFNKGYEHFVVALGDGSQSEKFSPSKVSHITVKLSRYGYKERIEEEYKSLNEKIKKLSLYISYEQPSGEAGELLRKQFNIMVEYSTVLRERMELMG